MVELVSTKVAPINLQINERREPTHEQVNAELTAIVPTTEGSPEKEALSPMKKKPAPEVVRLSDRKYFEGLDQIYATYFKDRPKFHQIMEKQGTLVFPENTARFADED